MSDQEKNAKCLVCGNTGDQAVLIACLKENQPNWVCVSCLPILIHGAH